MIDQLALIKTIRFLIPGLFSMSFRAFGLGNRGKKYVVVGFVFFIAYMCTVPMVLIPVFGYETYSKLAPAIMTLGNLIVFYFSSDSFIKTVFLHFVQATVVISLSITLNAMRYVFGWDEWLMPAILAIGFGLAYLLAMKFCVKPLRFIADNIQTGWLSLIVIPAATIFVIIALSVYSGVYYYRQLFVVIVTVAVEVCFLLYIGILYRSLKAIGTLAERELEYELDRVAINAMKDQMSLIDQEYRTRLNGIEEVKRIRHDIDHHLIVLDALLEKQDSVGALEYLRRIEGSIPRERLSNKNLITESFVERYRSLCETEGIVFSSKIEFDEDAVLDKTSFGVLLGNALRNAYEAASSTEAYDRFVSMEGKRANAAIVIAVRNSYNGILNPGYASTKKDAGLLHGFGLSNIKRTLDRYDGYLEINHTDTEFVLTMILPLNTLEAS